MTAVFGFLVHYWLFTAGMLACLWVLLVHVLRHKEVGAVGRTLARRENKRTEKYLEDVAHEATRLRSDDDPL